MLEVNKISLFREPDWVFKDLSFSLKAHECLSIYGPNGSGKTSLLKAIAGFCALEEGLITWNKKSITQMDVSYFGHQIPFSPELNTFEMLQFWFSASGQKKSKEDLLKKLKEMRLCSDKKIRFLSQGQKKRLYLSFFMHSNTRPLWLLDEFYTNLDAEASKIFGNALDFHLSCGGIAIFTTHNPLPIFENKKLFLNKN